MAKAIQLMVRVLGLNRSIAFYEKALQLTVADRYDFETFTLVYQRNEKADFEVELTSNKGHTEAYALGDGYGHVAFCVDDLDAKHWRCAAAGLAPEKIVAFERDGALMVRIFFLKDPDGYRIEFLQRHGRYR